MEQLRPAVLALAAALLLAGAPVWTQNAQAATAAEAEVRLEPLPLAVSLGQAAVPLDLERFVEAALAFSGASREEAEQARGALAAASARIAAEVSAESPERAAEKVLELMHRDLLTSYRERQTRLDTLLAEGTFNCVSSAVLYSALLKSLGFRVWGVRTSDHAFSRLQAGERAYDVETTSPFGFDPGSRREFSDSFGKVTGYAYVPPGNYSQRREIDGRELLVLILYNRQAFLSEERRYAEAVPPAVDAYAALGNKEAYDRLITSLLNLASWYGLHRQFDQALAFMQRAASRFPEEPRLSALVRDLTHNRIVTLIEEGRLEDAEAVLGRAREAGTLDAGLWKTLTVYLYQVRARELSRRDYLEAARLIARAMTAVGQVGELTRSFEVYTHNQVVRLTQGGRLQEALEVAEEGLRTLPQSSLLARDRSLLQARLQQTR